MPIRFALAMATVTALTACTADERTAPVASSSARQCFQLSQVSGFSGAGRDRVLVHTGPGETWLFRTMGPCPDLDFSEALALDATPGGSICSGLNVDLIVPTAIGPRRCPVAMIRKLERGEQPRR